MPGVLRLLDSFVPAPRSRQVPTELSAFLDLLARHHVRSYLEIGAYRGGTFYRVMRSLPPGSFGVTIDDDRRSKKRGRASPLAKVGARLERLGYRVETVVGDSHAPATVAEARRLGPFDAILIDADHNYHAVKRDWEDYGPMATRLMAFHDIADSHTTRSGRPVEVARLWQEIKATGARTHEFVAPDSKMGIGVVLGAEIAG